MDRTSLARLLRPLASAGLVKIGPREDRRTRDVSLMADGLEAVLGSIPLWETAQAMVLGRMGQRRWDEMRGNLSVAMSLSQ